jgi:hypothetical protein
MRRRAWLVGGALSVAALGSAAGAWAATRDPARARAPWAAAGTAGDADPRIRALRWAVLAPNPHNRQPWLVTLDSEDGLTLTCDLERRLPETDPLDRQIVIGLGCFLELLRQAAAAERRALHIEPFPAGEPLPRLDERPVARLRLGPLGSAVPDPLFAAAPYRRSTKEPYDPDRPVAAAALAGLLAPVGGSAGGSVAPASIERLRALTWEAFEIEARTPRTFMESVRLMRIGRAEIEASPDGIDLGGPLLELLAVTGVLTRETLADPASTAFRQSLDMFRPIMGSAMGHVWIVTADDDRHAQLAAGRDWLRLNLAATAQGLAVHPLSQALQELPEMAAPHAGVHRLLAPAGGRVQMLGRIGYGPAVPASPRWPLETRLRPA